jgi:hypothetical protein
MKKHKAYEGRIHDYVFHLVVGRRVFAGRGRSRQPFTEYWNAEYMFTKLVPAKKICDEWKNIFRHGYEYWGGNEDS